MAAKELVEYVAKALVDDPDAVKVEVVEEDGATVIELHVAEDDMGKVIGRNGSVAKALRTLLKVTTARDGRSLETIGHYNPRSEPTEFVVDAERAKAWLDKGAQPSDTVVRLFKNAGILPSGK